MICDKHRAKGGGGDEGGAFAADNLETLPQLVLDRH